jgi:hypothetical protein
MEEKKEKIRVWARVTPNINAELDKWSEELGVSKTNLISICIVAGLKGVIRMTAPEKSLTPEDWMNIFKAGQVVGKVPDLTEELKGLLND